MPPLATLKARPRFRALLSFAAGCLSALSMAPASFWPILFLTISVLYIALSSTETGKQGFAVSWLFAFGYFLCSLSWIGNALLVDDTGYRWAYPLAVSGIPFFLAFYWGAAGALWTRFANGRKLWGYILFTGFFFTAELARGYLLTGFPWNLFAYSWVNQFEIRQTVQVIGTYGLTALTFLWAGAIGFLTICPNRLEKRLLLTTVSLSLVASISGGHFLIRTAQTENHNVNKAINIKIIPGHIRQNEKWKQEKLTENFNLYLEKSTNSNHKDTKPTLIIWPETAILDWYLRDPQMKSKITDMLKTYKSGAVLITGILRQSKRKNAIYNSVIMVSQSGNISNTYDKTHLVPFGEFIPFQDFIPLRAVTRFSGFVKGNGPEIFDTPFKITYAPSICYEIIFPHEILPSNKYPDFIINVTNDAWHAETAGPKQHATKAIYRAIEYGIPVIRSANMGISQIFLPHPQLETKN